MRTCPKCGEDFIGSCSKCYLKEVQAQRDADRRSTEAINENRRALAAQEELAERQMRHAENLVRKKLQMQLKLQEDFLDEQRLIQEQTLNEQRRIQEQAQRENEELELGKTLTNISLLAVENKDKAKLALETFISSSLFKKNAKFGISEISNNRIIRELIEEIEAERARESALKVIRQAYSKSEVLEYVFQNIDDADSMRIINLLFNEDYVKSKYSCSLYEILVDEINALRGKYDRINEILNNLGLDYKLFSVLEHLPQNEAHWSFAVKKYLEEKGLFERKKLNAIERVKKEIESAANADIKNLRKWKNLYVAKISQPLAKNCCENNKIKECLDSLNKSAEYMGYSILLAIFSTIVAWWKGAFSSIDYLFVIFSGTFFCTLFIFFKSFKQRLLTENELNEYFIQEIEIVVPPIAEQIEQNSDFSIFNEMKKIGERINAVLQRNELKEAGIYLSDFSETIEKGLLEVEKQSLETKTAVIDEGKKCGMENFLTLTSLGNIVTELSFEKEGLHSALLIVEKVFESNFSSDSLIIGKFSNNQFSFVTNSKEKGTVLFSAHENLQKPVKPWSINLFDLEKLDLLFGSGSHVHVKIFNENIIYSNETTDFIAPLQEPSSEGITQIQNLESFQFEGKLLFNRKEMLSKLSNVLCFLPSESSGNGITLKIDSDGIRVCVQENTNLLIEESIFLRNNNLPTSLQIDCPAFFQICSILTCDEIQINIVKNTEFVMIQPKGDEPLSVKFFLKPMN